MRSTRKRSSSKASTDLQLNLAIVKRATWCRCSCVGNGALVLPTVPATEGVELVDVSCVGCSIRHLHEEAHEPTRTHVHDTRRVSCATARIPSIPINVNTYTHQFTWLVLPNEGPNELSRKLLHASLSKVHLRRGAGAAHLSSGNVDHHTDNQLSLLRGLPSPHWG